MRLVVGVAVVFAWLPLSAQGATFHVAPTGSDAQPGTAEQPLATLEAARDAARKAQGGPHRIVLMPGDYFLAQPLELDARDNGLTLEAGEEGSVTLYGGTPVTAWQPDGDRFWYADLPGVKEGTWDFRALVVNGRLPERARIPESGTLEHQSVWNVRYLTNVGGDWERKPTPEDLTTLLYNPQDIPPTLDPRNAELRVYHMWDESLVGLARNDTERHAFLFSSPAVNPPGAFGVKKYVIFNTREGMTHPGQWYLDRTAGRVVYWPLPGEDMAKAKVIAPRLERLIGIAGTAQKPVEGITLRGFALAATTTPLKPAGFGANQLDGAVRLESARRCTLEKLQVSQVGGQGLKAQRAADCRIADCHIHHTGGCGLQIEGSGTLVAGNHVHHVGIYHPSAVAMYVNHYSGSPDARDRACTATRFTMAPTAASSPAAGTSRSRRI